MSTRKKPAPKKPPAKRRKRRKAAPPATWTVDTAGRWREPSGRFASRAALLGQLKAGTPEDIGMMLADAGRNVPEGGPDDYAVVGHFYNVGWRTLSYATGLRSALEQAGDWLANQIGQELGWYGEEPTLIDVQVRRMSKGRGPLVTKKQRTAAKEAATKAAVKASYAKRKASRATKRATKGGKR